MVQYPMKTKTILTTGTIFNSEEEMKPYVEHFGSSCTFQIRISTMFELRQKILILLKDKKLKKLGKSVIYFTLSQSHDHAHIHVFSNDYEAIMEFHAQVPYLSEYIYSGCEWMIVFILLRTVLFFSTVLFFIDIFSF